MPLSPIGDATAGALGAMFACLVCYPLDVLKTRLQVLATQQRSTKQVQSPTLLSLFQQIHQRRAYHELYAGWVGALAGVASTNFAYFYFYASLRHLWIRRQKTATLSTVSELLVGALAAALGQIFTLPVSVLTTLQQTSSQALSLRAAAERVLQEDGITGLWRGLRPSLILVVNPAITYGVYARVEQIYRSMKAKQQRLTAFEVFLLGAFCKTLATIVTYPLIMVKVRMQYREESDLNQKQKSKTLSPPRTMIPLLLFIAQTQGFLGLYKGMSAQIGKAVLSQAILFLAKDKFTELVRLWMK